MKVFDHSYDESWMNEDNEGELSYLYYYIIGN